MMRLATRRSFQGRCDMASDRTREPLRGALIAIVAAAIGALGTLGGNALSTANARALLENENEVRQEDLRRDAYEGFVTAATKLVLEIQAVSVTEKGDFSAFKRDYLEVIETLSAVRLVGSREAAGLAYTIADDLIKLGNGLNDGLDPVEARDRAGVIATEKLYGDFVSTGIEELSAE
jgi:hypothetical protein